MAEAVAAGVPVPAGHGDDVPVALTLHQAADLVGAYRWVEQRLFAVTGRWASDPAMTPAGQVHLFEASSQHAWHAELWAERLPVLAGMDPEALTRPVGPVVGPLMAALEAEAPEAGEAGTGHAAPAALSAVARLAGLHRVVLPALVTSYRRHLPRTVPVADGPVTRALQLALADLEEEQAAGEVLLGTLLAGEGAPAAADAALGRLGPLLAGSAADGCLVPWPVRGARSSDPHFRG